MTLSGVIVIRDYRPGDKLQCQEIIRESTMSTVNIAFLTGLTREITYQIIVLSLALMFIFFGVPFNFCLCAIPCVIVGIYVGIYAGHTFKALEMTQDINNIPRVYMSSKDTGFWVAEAYEPFFAKPLPGQKMTLVSEQSLSSCGLELTTCRRSIVGTVAITKSKDTENAGWLRRMAVRPQYQRRGIAFALLNEAISFCRNCGYSEVELVTSECHHAARELYLKHDFEIKQMYHKPILGSFVTFSMFLFVFKLNSNHVKNRL